MTTMKPGVVLLALLLAGMMMIPIVSAVNASEPSDVMSNSLVNETTKNNDETLPAIQWVTHEIDASKYSKPLTREEFVAANKEYLDYISKTAGKETAEKYVNDFP
jgi:hypothetical protein